MSLLLGICAVLLGPPEPAPQPTPRQAPVSAEQAVGLVDEHRPDARVDARPRQFEASPHAMVFRAGAMLMTRAALTLSRSTDDASTRRYQLPTRLRARLEARADRFRLLAEVQDARTIADPIGQARSGAHQLFAEFSAPLPGGTLNIRAGRQEYVVGSEHLFGRGPWGAGMRSWDGLRLLLELDKGGFDVFAASLARPLLSAGVPLVDHIQAQIEVDWVVEGHLAVADALELEALIWGRHGQAQGETRNIYTPSVRLHGALAPGLRYEAEGQLQTGTIAAADATTPSRHLAGASYLRLAYLTPRGFASGRTKLGAALSFDYASGSRCTTTEFDGLAPCTEGVNHDFDAPWMARHRWFGNADRFRAVNVLDYALGLRAEHRPRQDLRLDLRATEHVLAFAQPDGRWLDTGGRLVGIDLDNTNPWAANELDLQARLRHRWLQLDLGWMLVANLAGGRRLSGEALRQFAYLRVIIDF